MISTHEIEPVTIPEDITALLAISPDESVTRARGLIAEAKPARIVTLGPAGSNADTLTSHINPAGSEITTEYVTSNEDLLESLSRDTTDQDQENLTWGIVPVANTIGRWVMAQDQESARRRPIREILVAKDLRVMGLASMAIEHCLLRHPSSSEEIYGRVVRSHPQAHLQCSRIIGKHALNPVEAPSTSKAAQDVASGTGLQSDLVIASRRAAIINGLSVAQHDIGDLTAAENRTVMAIVSQAR